MLLHDFFETIYLPLKLRNRSDNTVRLYRYSIRCFEETLGRPATLEDLTDTQVSMHLARLVADKRSPYTVNKERSQLLAIWSFAARKRYVEAFPDVEPEVAPKRAPLAWLESDMRRLVQACHDQTGYYDGIPAATWWIAIHEVCWDTAERIGAIRQLTWEHLNSDGWLIVPAELRKGKREDKCFLLGPDTLGTLQAISLPERRLIFPWPFSTTYLYHVYRKILRRAGLPTDSRSKFHRLRRTAASYYEAAGGNATDLLGHANRETTKRYLDPRIVKQKQPSEVLFRLEGVAHHGINRSRSGT
ncbi:MAG: site-specific integrase [Planctomycetaceae bacterium]|nr:site-specific integrase [Planctomycetaceae bacterium]